MSQLYVHECVYTHVYMYYPLFFGFASRLGLRRALGIVPCAYSGFSSSSILYIVVFICHFQSPNQPSPLISIHLFSLSVSLFHSSFYSSHAGLLSAPPSPPCSLPTHFKAFVHPAHLLGLLPSEIFAGLVLPGLISSTASLDLLITQPQGLPPCISLFPTSWLPSGNSGSCAEPGLWLTALCLPRIPSMMPGSESANWVRNGIRSLHGAVTLGGSQSQKTTIHLWLSCGSHSFRLSWEGFVHCVTSL